NGGDRHFFNRQPKQNIASEREKHLYRVLQNRTAIKGSPPASRRLRRLPPTRWLALRAGAPPFRGTCSGERVRRHRLAPAPIASISAGGGNDIVGLVWRARRACDGIRGHAPPWHRAFPRGAFRVARAGRRALPGPSGRVAALRRAASRARWRTRPRGVVRALESRARGGAGALARRRPLGAHLAR